MTHPIPIENYPGWWLWTAFFIHVLGAPTLAVLFMRTGRECRKEAAWWVAMVLITAFYGFILVTA